MISTSLFLWIVEGKLHVELQRENYTTSDIIAANPELLPGGMWRPKHCMARHKVAVIIPYRDREEHLSLLLYHLHPMLRKQQLDYTVMVVEQVRVMISQITRSVRVYQINTGTVQDLCHKKTFYLQNLTFNLDPQLHVPGNSIYFWSFVSHREFMSLFFLK